MSGEVTDPSQAPVSATHTTASTVGGQLSPRSLLSATNNGESPSTINLTWKHRLKALLSQCCACKNRDEAYTSRVEVITPADDNVGLSENDIIIVKMRRKEDKDGNPIIEDPQIQQLHLVNAEWKVLCYE